MTIIKDCKIFNHFSNMSRRGDPFAGPIVHVLKPMGFIFASQSAKWSLGGEDLLYSDDKPILSSEYMSSRMRHALLSKDYKTVRLLIDNGVDVNGMLFYMSFLMYAVNSEDMNIICLLIKAPRININSINNQGKNVCHFAKTADVFEILVANGANPDIADNDHVTPLMNACMTKDYTLVKYILSLSILHDCAPQNIKILVKVAISRGIDVLGVKSAGVEALCKAVKAQLVSTVKLLLELGVDPNGSFKLGEANPFAEACSLGGVKILSLFLSLVPEKLIHLDRDTRNIPFFFAVENGNLPAVKLLLAAEPRILGEQERYGASWLHFATSKKMKKYFIKHKNVRSCHNSKVQISQCCLSCNVYFCGNCCITQDCGGCDNYLCEICVEEKSTVGFMQCTLSHWNGLCSLICYQCVAATQIQNSRKLLIANYQKNNIFVDCKFCF